MKFFIICDGIIGVYFYSGLVQYINRIVGGFSGLFCFNENGELVVLYYV